MWIVLFEPFGRSAEEEIERVWPAVDPSQSTDLFPFWRWLKSRRSADDHPTSLDPHFDEISVAKRKLFDWIFGHNQSFIEKKRFD